MTIALIATILGPESGNIGRIIIAMIIGGAIGIYLARKVEMTEMPELVAVLHSFVGLAAVLVGFNSYLDQGIPMEPVMENIHLTELMLPNRHKLNLAALALSFLLLLMFVCTERLGWQVVALLLMTVIALAFSGVYRWCRHASSGVDAQLLLRLGGGRLYAEQ